MLNRFLYFVGFVLCAGVLYFFLSDITRKDVIAANAFGVEVKAEALTAGDMVVLEETGGMSRLCNASVRPEDLEMEQRSGLYFNRARFIMDWATQLAQGVGLMAPGHAETTKLRSRVPFAGDSSTLSGMEYTYINAETCHCDVARALGRGDKVCTVSASLVETSTVLLEEDGSISVHPAGRRTLAVALRRHVNWLPDEVFRACGIDDLSDARLTMQELCSQGDLLPLDVRLRQKLNLIDHEELRPIAEASLTD